MNIHFFTLFIAVNDFGHFFNILFLIYPFECKFLHFFLLASGLLQQDGGKLSDLWSFSYAKEKSHFSYIFQHPAINYIMPTNY